MAKCSISSCNLKTYGKGDKCILHTNEDKDKSPTFSRIPQDFYDAFIKYITEQIVRFKGTNQDSLKELIQEYFKNGECYDKESIEFLLSETNMVLGGFVFPERKDNYPQHDYLAVLLKLGGIHFNCCEFFGHYLELKNEKCFFQECVFHEYWLIDDVDILPNVNNVIFQHCEFNNDVSVCCESDERCVINRPLFYDCNFSGNVQFNSVDFNAPLFSSCDNYKPKIKSIELTDCIIADRFILNNSSLDFFAADKTVFKSEFEFANNVIDDFVVNNCSFHEVSDFCGSTFEKFRFEKSSFKNIVGFEGCTFGKGRSSDAEHIAFFIYVTFLNSANFRNANFLSGLDFELVTLSASLNFLNSYVPLHNTNRETFRIIKDSFQKIGNNIEANKFFVYEMKKYREELRHAKGRGQEKVIFCLNDWISDFGECYWKPAILFFITTILYKCVIWGYNKDLLYKICPPFNGFICASAELFNSLVRDIPHFSKVLRSGMEFVSFIFYLFFVILIWQTVVAVKRHVRR